MHHFVEWLISKVGFRRMRKAYLPVRREQPVRREHPHASQLPSPDIKEPLRRLPAILLVLMPFANSAMGQLSVDSISNTVGTADRYVSLARQGAGAGVDATLRRMGLAAAWRSQLQMPIESGSIVSTHLWAVPNEKRTYAELTLPAGMVSGNRTFRSSADRIGDNGEPIGLNAAKKEVEIAAARALGRFSNIPPVEVAYPVVYLVVVSSDGIVQTFDAESGQHLWSNGGDSVRFPAAPASVSDAGVMVAHGTRLYLYDWKTGKSISRELERASCSGVALSGDVAFVSSLSGQVAAYRFSRDPAEKTSLQSPWRYRLFGRSISAPVASDRSQGLVAFSTSSGVVTVLSALKKIEPWFNFDAHSPLAGPIGFSGDAIYCGDVTGQISKVVADRVGRVEWRTILGSVLASLPIVVENQAYLVSEVGELHCLDDSNGRRVWREPVDGIRSVLAVSNERVYCRTKLDQLKVLDARNGNLIGATSLPVIATDLVNMLNDRVYLISSGGQVTCLRQMGNEFLMPKFHSPLPPAPEGGKPKAQVEEAAPMENAPENAESTGDPFGTGVGAAMTEDPLGTPKPADTTDPFATPAPAAGGANPF